MAINSDKDYIDWLIHSTDTTPCWLPMGLHNEMEQQMEQSNCALLDAFALMPDADGGFSIESSMEPSRSIPASSSRWVSLCAPEGFVLFSSWTRLRVTTKRETCLANA